LASTARDDEAEAQRLLSTTPKMTHDDGPDALELAVRRLELLIDPP
jgi:hypothetical protein